MTRTRWRLPQSALRNRVPYVCPACQTTRSSTAFITSTRSLSLTYRLDVTSRRSSQLAQTRSYRTSRCLRATAVENSAELNPIEYNFRVKPNSQLLPRNGESVRNSRIRSSLRVWGDQNEELARINAPDSIAAHGRIRHLPNALFMGQSSQDEKLERATETPTSGMFEAEIGQTSSVIQPGTLLWFSGLGGSGQYAVYVGNIGIQSLLAIETGNWVVDSIGSLRKAAYDNRRLRISGFFQPKELEQLKLYMPKSTIARPISGGEGVSEISMKGLMPPALIETFLTVMHDFRETVADHTRLFADRCEEAYSRVAFQDEYRSMTICEFLMEGLGINWDAITSAEKMAISQHLAEQDAITSYQTAEDLSVLIMPKTMRKNFEQVVEWARQYQDTASKAALGRDVTLLLSENPLTGFIDKARRLILMSRKTRSPSVKGGLGPSSFTEVGPEARPEKIVTGIEFTQTDLMLIDMIWTVAFRVPTCAATGSLKLMPVTSLILRAVGAYPDLILNHTTARLFLKELGCADPWTPRTNDLALPVQGGKASQLTDALYHESKKHAKHVEQLLESGKFDDLDSMAHLRQKWTLPAFAIDSTASNMLEDALSIEPSTEIEGGYWVHVHVPHITAWFEPGSIVGRLAKHLGGSFTSIDGSVKASMLPRVLRDRFSLKQHSPVLTISTLIAEDGSSVDVKMRAGVLENFIRLSRGAVYELLGVHDNPLAERSVLLVGKISRPQPSAVESEDVVAAMKHKADLKLLADILQKRREKRIQELPENVSIPYYNFEAEVQTTPHERLDGKREQQSYHWKGDPGIVLTARHHISRETEARRSTEPVTQAMRLAAESTGRWLDARNIPAIFVGTEAAPDNSYDQIANKKSYERFFSPLYMRSSTPISHWSIHLKSFCNCTSPLRRYVDLLAVWQIDSYLKAEADGSIQPGTPVHNDSILSFSRGQIDEYLRFDAQAMDTADHSLRRFKETYIFQALFRAFHFNEAPLPKQWEVLVRTPVNLSAGLDEKNASGSLVPFGTPCEILPDPTGWAKMAQPGQFLPVTITAIDPEALLVQCTAIGVPNDKQSMLEKIHAVNDKMSITR